MEKSHPVSTPLDPNIKLIKLDKEEEYDMPDYQAAVGSLMYTAIGTRPDISFAVQTLSQFNSNPGPIHWMAVKRVFQYLNRIRSLGITYSNTGPILPYRFSDADWGSNVNDRWSISGNIFFIANRPVT